MQEAPTSEPESTPKQDYFLTRLLKDSLNKLCHILGREIALERKNDIRKHMNAMIRRIKLRIVRSISTKGTKCSKYSRTATMILYEHFE